MSKFKEYICIFLMICIIILTIIFNYKINIELKEIYNLINDSQNTIVLTIQLPQEEPEEYKEEIQEESFELEKEEESCQYTYDGMVLDAYLGRVPTVDGRGTETWYNLDMSWIIELMRSRGFSEEEYPYWIRDDGCKMLGDYIMCAANLDIYPRGSIVQLTLGEGLVCDTGGFVVDNPYGFDVAVNWEEE